MSFCPMLDTPKEVKEKQNGLHRLTIPHVITQWKPGQFSRDGTSVKEKNKAEKKSNESAKSCKSAMKKQQAVDAVSLSNSSIQATPKSKRWDFGTIRHRRQASSETAITPRSAIDPVFEKEETTSPETPSSSANSSPWVFELEDTSQIALHSKRSAFPGPQLEFQSSAITSRSVIKVIDQTIAAIEADNRKLLSRAVAAEQCVKALREHNLNLQLKVEHCEKTHHRQPHAVASQPALRQPRAKPSTPDSSKRFDQLITEFPLPAHESRRSVAKHMSPTARQTVHPEYPPPLQVPNKPLPETPTRSCHPSEGDVGSPRSPVLALSPRLPAAAASTTPTASPRTPVQRSPVKSPITPRRVSRCMSKAPKRSSCTDARLRAKPLPPLGPISPSAVRGKFEIGLGIDANQYRELEGDLATSEREFITGLFGPNSPRAGTPLIIEMEEKKWI
ncbi:hypothetical protein BJ875DRAFT_485680 [Amylocarpus encephaloides]|uniref:Uncharacterized protein n=1 Tax=Amylocarpus encephaloides TaxID=45428 RepID=A0A9P8C5A8_9HELO|nr:hypothetical protein BJ875DRAFT_485680 [Amylocarpus encephaloides]